MKGKEIQRVDPLVSYSQCIFHCWSMPTDARRNAKVNLVKCKVGEGLPSEVNGLNLSKCVVLGVEEHCMQIMCHGGA